jgi:hypothetical protein
LDLQLFCFPWKAAILTQLRWSRQNCGWCWTPSQNMTSRMYLKNGKSAREGTTLRVMVVSRPKSVFDQMAAPGLEITSYIYITTIANHTYKLKFPCHLQQLHYSVLHSLRKRRTRIFWRVGSIYVGDHFSCEW